MKSTNVLYVMMNLRGWLVLGVSALLILGLSSAVAWSAQSDIASSTRQVVLYLNQKEALVNGNAATASYPPSVLNGRTFVPAKFLSEVFGFSLVYDGATKSITMTLPNQSIIFMDSKKKEVLVDGFPLEWDKIATIQDGNLLLQLGWLCDLLDARYTYDKALKKIVIQYVRPPVPIYNVDSDNSNPTAKFALNQPFYRLGEPVKYIDLSYDADGDGIVHYSWSGKEEAFFKAGSYPVTLKVTDKQGHVSTAYTRQVVVHDIPYLTAEEFPFYHYEVGRYISLTEGQKVFYKNAPSAGSDSTADEDRVLLVSDSPETMTEEGILYQDVVSGKARLYAHHLNGTNERMNLAVLVTNHGIAPVTLTTTNKGEVYPTLYTHLIGYQAAIDFLLKDPHHEQMTIAPGETRNFKQMPVMLPQQGVNMIYDVETDGKVTFSFVAAHSETGFDDVLKEGKMLAYNGHVRGTFHQANVMKVLDGRKLATDNQLLIGDGESDRFVMGFDTLSGNYTQNRGNYGVMYQVEIRNPGRMAISLLPRGGSFKGGLRINGEMVLAPEQGVMTAYDGLKLLARTSGDEPSVTIEFMPPAGSSLPISLVLTKLDKH